MGVQGQSLSEAYADTQAAFTRGNFGEALRLCTDILNEIRSTDITDEEFQLKIMRLLIATGDIAWRGQTELPGGLNIPHLIDEAEQLARKGDHKALLAQILHLKAGWLLYTTAVPPSLDTLRQALVIAKESQDRLTEFIVMSALGHQTVKMDMDEGIALLYRAQELYARYTDVINTSDQSPELVRSQLYARASLGINEFDRGNYDKARSLLLATLEQYRQAGLMFDLPVVLNFLAQVETASGRFEDAEAHLQYAISLFDEITQPNPWNGNNLALLGKLYVEWERLDQAAAPLERSWFESEPTHNLDLISLVRNYYGEYLMHPQNKQRDLERAERFLQENLAETRATVIHRSTIQSLSLLGQLRLNKNDSQAALTYSQEAVTLLEQFGNMPALRMEEIYFNHYLVLQALGQFDEAKRSLEKAYVALQRIVVADEKAFLSRIPLNRAILHAKES